jgi:flagellar assembly protein FliH
LSSVVRNGHVEDAAFYLRPPHRFVGVGGGEARISEEQDRLPVYTPTELAEAVRDAEERTRSSMTAERERERRLLESRTDEVVARLAAATQAATEQARDLVSAAGERVLELAFAIARRVVRTQFTITPDPIVPLVRELLARVASTEQVLVRLSPDDHAFVEERRGALGEAGSTDRLRFRADATVPPGGCLLEAEEGTWDGRVDVQLERIERTLLDVFRSRLVLNLERGEDAAIPSGNRSGRTRAEGEERDAA